MTSIFHEIVIGPEAPIGAGVCKILDMAFQEHLPSRHWCENSLGGGSIFMALG